MGKYMRVDYKRFIKRVAVGYGPNSCWLWTGSATPTGYGRVYTGEHGNTYVPATHAAWFLAGKGEVPHGHYLCHHCDNPSCVNVAHLFIGTPSENMKDASRKKRLPFHAGIGIPALNAAKTHCKRGHPLSGENLYLYEDGTRACRMCRYSSGASRNLALKLARHAAKNDLLAHVQAMKEGRT